MPIPSPNLDDRSFEDLLEEAKQRIRASCPQWTDLSTGDPGVALLEAFAYLTDVMIYRLNRIPEKNYVEFLRLLGVQLQPPAAAAVKLEFRLSRPDEKRTVEIPRFTRVTLSRSSSGTEAPVFVTAHAVRLGGGTGANAAVEVLAHHSEIVEGEPVGEGDGQAGQSIQVRRSPIIAPTGDDRDLVVGVELSREELASLDQRVPAIQWEGKTYRVWKEVENFSNLEPDQRVYVADRNSGQIIFAPSLRAREVDGVLKEFPETVAAVPPAGRGIRLWYRRGGGPQGNVSAHTLTVLKTPIAWLDDMRLAVLYSATASCGSIVLGLALLEGHLGAAEAFAASQIDESYQIERWGTDVESDAHRVALQVDIEAGARFLELLAG